jgi:ABC-type antimicrobial peptide transport system permease subunit
VILGGLALLLTVSGLFSVLSYLVEQRTREIGVRIALGAASRRVTLLMLAQTTRPVLFGLLAGAGLATSSATLMLATEARDDFRDRARHRSRRLRLQPAGDCYRLPVRGMDPRESSRPGRSDENAEAGIAIPAPAALFLRPADRRDHAVDAVRGHQFAVVLALVFEPAKQLRPRLRLDERIRGGNRRFHFGDD